MWISLEKAIYENRIWTDIIGKTRWITYRVIHNLSTTYPHDLLIRRILISPKKSLALVYHESTKLASENRF